MTLRKLTIVASALLFIVPTTVFAESTDSQDKASDENFVQESNNQLTVTPGVSYYRLQLPSFNFPFSVGYDTSSVTYNSTPYREFNPNQYTLAPTLAVGYAFANPGILPGFFGQNISVDATILYQHLNSTNNEDLNGTDGFIWPLNDKGTPDNDGGSNIFNSTSLTTRVDHGDFSLGISGNKPIFSSVTLKPRVALVFTYLKQDYNYEIDGVQRGVPSAFFDAWGDESVKTYYFGLALGSMLEYKPYKHVSVYSDAEVQALHANSQFVGDQTTSGPNSATAMPSHVKSSDSLYTYRAKGAVGVTYYSRDVNDPNSYKVSLEGGVDFWGYMPEVVNPDEAGESAHIDRTTSLSNFINLKLSIPLM